MDSTTDIIAMRDDAKLKAQGIAFAKELAAYYKLKSKGDKVDQASKPKPVKPSKPVAKPSTNKTITVDGYWGADTTRSLQRYFGTYVDGVVSGQYNTTTACQLISVTFNKSGSSVIKKLQNLVGVKADGLIGPATVEAMQIRFGTYADGVISKPSPMVRELQRRLNKGKL